MYYFEEMLKSEDISVFETAVSKYTQANNFQNMHDRRFLEKPQELLYPGILDRAC